MIVVGYWLLELVEVDGVKVALSKVEITQIATSRVACCVLRTRGTDQELARHVLERVRDLLAINSIATVRPRPSDDDAC